MEWRQKFLSALKKFFEKSPVASNVVFTFILIGLEKIVEWEFECPCNPKFNAWLAAAFFVVPTVVIFLLMIVSQECSCENFCLSLVPASVWLNLVFLDGKYFACATTHWSGEYVTVSGSPHFKWCEPVNKNLTEEYLSETKIWFTKSQTIGIWTIIVYTIPLGCIIYNKCKKCCSECRNEKCCKKCCSECCKKCCRDTEDQESSTRQNMEESSV